MLEANVDKSLADDDGCTALMLASIRGHVKVVRLLLEAGVDKTSASNDGFTVLILASLLGHDEVARDRKSVV